MLLKIGELARRTGLTVRALHHYDAIGLLRPSARSDAGYRLYNRADVERLYRIQALRRLDLPLADIAALLERDGADLRSVVEQQIAQLERQAARAIALRDRLKLLQARLADDGQPDLPDWLATLELMTMYDKYFTRDELATMHALTERLGGAIASEAKTLTARIRDLMDRGVPAASEAAQALAKPWMALVNARMGSDVRLIMKLDAMHRNEPMVQALSGVDGAMIDYMAQAFLEYRLGLYRKYLSEQEVAPLRGKFFAHRERWVALTAATRELMERAADPCGPETQELCLRWQALDRDLWGSDPALLEKVRRAHAGEPDLLIGPCVDRAMLAFLEAGMACLAGQQQDMKANLHESTAI